MPVADCLPVLRLARPSLIFPGRALVLEEVQLPRSRRWSSSVLKTWRPYSACWQIRELSLAPRSSLRRSAAGSVNHCLIRSRRSPSAPGPSSPKTRARTPSSTDSCESVFCWPLGSVKVTDHDQRWPSPSSIFSGSNVPSNPARYSASGPATMSCQVTLPSHEDDAARKLSAIRRVSSSPIRWLPGPDAVSTDAAGDVVALAGLGHPLADSRSSLPCSPSLPVPYPGCGPTHHRPRRRHDETLAGERPDARVGDP